MKVTVGKQNLLSAIQITERMVGKKESLPVLSCILLSAQSSFSIRATNLEAGLEVVVSGQIQEKGEVAVSAQILSQTIRSIVGDMIELWVEEGNLHVQSRGTKTLIKSVPHDEFPILPRSNANGLVISREIFLKGLGSVVYAASPSMIRPELGSVYIQTKGNSVVFVATDSFRLAEKTISNKVDVDEFELLIPLKHATELIYVLEKISNETLSLVVEESQMMIFTSEVYFSSRVVDGNFPDYKAIIPKTPSSEITLLKADFGDMLKKARVFSGEEQQVGLHVYPKKKIFSATARNPQIGEMSDSLDAALSGEDVDINFHIGYLSECLSSIPTDSITLSFSGVGRPLIIRGTGDSSFMYLVMPLNR
ncbi:MAG: hypothetical protein RIQ56_397 [Candidatus Parcubacteria bacterium]|jgi:DNA polymerase-3 subunit beta